MRQRTAATDANIMNAATMIDTMISRIRSWDSVDFSLTVAAVDVNKRREESRKEIVDFSSGFRFVRYQ